MKRDLNTMPLEELLALVESGFLEKASPKQVAIIQQRIAAGRPPQRLRSGRFRERLKLGLRFEQPWLRTLRLGGRIPLPRRASVEELQSQLGVGGEDCDLCIKPDHSSEDPPTHRAGAHPPTPASQSDDQGKAPPN
jgi:hypothetical protein